MKVAINIEFTTEELLKHGQDLGRRIVLTGIHDLIRHINIDPATAATLMTAAANFASSSRQPPMQPDADFEGAPPPGEPPPNGAATDESPQDTA